jgi:hypothetical protein
MANSHYVNVKIQISVALNPSLLQAVNIENLNPQLIHWHTLPMSPMEAKSDAAYLS